MLVKTNLKNNLKVKPRRLPRLDREISVEVHEDDNGHLWAVSYADFLMVLLSFFILFYSTDNKSRENLIFKISKQFSKDSASPQTVTSGVGRNLTASEIATDSHEVLIQSLKSLNLAVTKDRMTLIVDFPDDLFLTGRYKLTDKQTRSLSEFLEKLKPYNGKVNLYFEGHTDSKPLVIHRNDLVTDNYILSSLRAMAALNIAKAMNFDEKTLYMQGNSSNIRNSRSLSIRIEPKEVSL